MKHFQKYRCRLQTCSALVLSPREQGAYYRGAGDFDDECLDESPKIGDKGRVNIVYPFYQYGYQGRYRPQRAQHYIPGSSLKGAIGSDQLQVDDFAVDGSCIHLRTLMKVEKGKADLQEFFPNVAVEMMDAGMECTGEIFSGMDLRELLPAAEEKAKNRLQQLSARLDTLIACAPPCGEDLKRLRENIADLRARRPGDKNGWLLLLGGYKGMLLSGEFTTEELQSAIFVDKDTMLPHGLVLLHLEDG